MPDGWEVRESKRFVGKINDDVTPLPVMRVLHMQLGAFLGVGKSNAAVLIGIPEIKQNAACSRDDHFRFDDGRAFLPTAVAVEDFDRAVGRRERFGVHEALSGKWIIVGCEYIGRQRLHFAAEEVIEEVHEIIGLMATAERIDLRLVRLIGVARAPW